MDKVILFIFGFFIIALYFKFKTVPTYGMGNIYKNTKCKICMTQKGYHYHNLSINLDHKFENMASSGTHCQFCMEHPNEFHTH